MILSSLTGRKEMNDRVFVDTNIWVYAKINGKDDIKRKMAIDFLSKLKVQVYISTQIINEFFNVLAKNKIDNDKIIESIYQILNNVILSEVTFSIIERSWKLREKYHYSVYDSLILASAIESDCTILYSEDLHHNQLVENKLRIINPFK
jgi:predicted nucleic acid-binding protein